MKFLLYFFLFLTGLVWSANSASARLTADGGGKPVTITVKSSIQCGMCQKTVKTALKAVPGVTKVNSSIVSGDISISYKPSQTSPEKIRQAISRAGYDADNVPADLGAYAKLPACCKKPAGK